MLFIETLHFYLLPVLRYYVKYYLQKKQKTKYTFVHNARCFICRKSFNSCLLSDLFSPFPSPLSTTGRLTLANYKSKARCQKAGFRQLEAMEHIGRRGGKRSQNVSHLTPFALGRVSSSCCSFLVSPLNHDLSSRQEVCLFSTSQSWLITPGWLPAKVPAPTGLWHQVSG